MFRKVLIANRGEIAARIAQTVQQMGMVAVAVYSESDASAVHVRACDESYPLTGNASADTYLRGDRIVELALANDVDAVHPGYGFLSENAEFAQACQDAGLAFIGPTPAVIRAMGDKIIAKQAMSEAGVPIAPGWACEPGADMARITAEASRIGYPVLVKAAAGGGGKGMRIARKDADLPAAVDSAQREALAAFGDARVFLEKYIDSPRHIEFQIFGDAHGNVVHLFERECSIQRRHQKIIEESPSIALTPELRETMGQAALSAARALGYTNAGTVEFMLAPDGQFYFLEVNTRLQVEHPVTEMVTGHDLVWAQIMVAAGERLPFEQGTLRQTGHAVECRIYAEDALAGFLPSTGKIGWYQAPAGPNVRVDSGVTTESEVSVHYDPMLAKLVVWGRDRAEALARMRWALQRFIVLGVTTNIDFLQDVIADEEFAAGQIDTHFLQRRDIGGDWKLSAEAVIAAAIAAGGGAAPRRESNFTPATGSEGPWDAGGHWRGI